MITKIIFPENQSQKQKNKEKERRERYILVKRYVECGTEDPGYLSYVGIEIHDPYQDQKKESIT